MAQQSSPSMCQVFISYARQDQEFVLRLAEDLRQRDVDLWLDQFDIIPGEPWDDQIQTALGSCRHLLAILSPTAVESQNFKDEINFAFDEGKTIIPVLYRETEIPFRLRRLQYVDFQADYDQALDSLAELLPSNPASKPEAGTSQLAEATTSPRAEPTPAQAGQPIPEVDAAPAPTAAPKGGRGLPKWVVGAGVGGVVLVVTVVAMTLSARAVQPSTPSSSTPTPTVSPTALPGRPHMQTSQEISVYRVSDTLFEKVGQTSVNQVLNVIATNREGTWWQVCCVAGDPVWIRADLVTVQGSTDEVPVVTLVTTPTPAPTATATANPSPTATATRTTSPTATPDYILEFTADKTVVNPGEWVTLRWHVENVQAVYLDWKGGKGESGIGEDPRQMWETTDHTLRVVLKNGETVTRTITITVR